MKMAKKSTAQKKPRDESMKRRVLRELYRRCEAAGNFDFDNKLVKEVSREINLGNPFDATKIDRRELLPPNLVAQDIAVIHTGNGQHRFVHGLHIAFHELESSQREITWPYQKSLLNEYNTSESNSLSVANNQRILHHFTFGQDREFDDVDITKRPKTYFPHRTKTDLSYHFDALGEVRLERIQIEIDLTIEFQGTIAIFEAKKGRPKNFAVYQLYHPFLYYHAARQKEAMKDKIKDIVCVYMVSQKLAKRTLIKLWKYTFTDPYNIASIKFLDSACYHLVRTESDQ